MKIWTSGITLNLTMENNLPLLLVHFTIILRRPLLFPYHQKQTWPNVSQLEINDNSMYKTVDLDHLRKRKMEHLWNKKNYTIKDYGTLLMVDSKICQSDWLNRCPKLNYWQSLCWLKWWGNEKVSEFDFHWQKHF